MLVVALTGDVGAGKTTVINEWRAQGANVIDSDAIAKSQWHKPEIIARAVERWSDYVAPNGEIVLRRVAEKAFNSEGDYKFLCDLIHPGTIGEIKKEVARLRGWIAVEIPLVFEAGADPDFDKVVYASAPLAMRGLFCRSRGWGTDEIRRREKRLLPREEKIARSDYVIENMGTLDEWRAKARALGEELLRLADQ